MLRSKGFTLIELTVVLVIAGLLFAVSIPNLSAMSESLAYRSSVREVLSAAQSARREATRSGRAVDLLIDTKSRELAVRPAGSDDFGDRRALGGLTDLAVTTAAEVSPSSSVAGIRFYPFGGSTGGDIELMGPGGAGTLVQVSWLMGDVRRSDLR